MTKIESLRDLITDAFTTVRQLTSTEFRNAHTLLREVKDECDALTRDLKNVTEANDFHKRELQDLKKLLDIKSAEITQLKVFALNNNEYSANMRENYLSKMRQLDQLRASNAAQKTIIQAIQRALEPKERF